MNPSPHLNSDEGNASTRREPIRVADDAAISKPLKHICMFSGGVCSWAAAKRVVARHGAENVALLFADTCMEDEDLYRFLHEAAANVGAPLYITRDGRTPWEVMRDHKCIAKPRMDMCSRELKRDRLDAWRNKHGDPSITTIHIGIDWTEEHRLHRVQELCKPWRYAAPMCEAPYLTKPQMLAWLKQEGIVPPRLYGMGFPHNNCGGFCIKAGHAHFAHLLKTIPDRYAWHEAKEEEMRRLVGDYSILRDRRGGTTKTFTLRMLRERVESQQAYDNHDWGGCGCAIE